MYRYNFFILILIFSLAGCVTTKRDISPKSVDSIKIELVDQNGISVGSSGVIPGVMYTAEIIAIDKNGFEYFYSDGEIDKEHMRLNTKGFEVNGIRFFVKSGDKTSDEFASINVEYGMGEKMVERYQDYPIDKAAAYGPDPDDVESIKVSFKEKDKSTTPSTLDDFGIIPGRKYVLYDLKAQDKEGRVYTSGLSYPRLPIDRLHVSGSGIEGVEISNNKLILTFSSEQQFAADGYNIDIGYSHPGFDEAQSFLKLNYPSDFDAAFGPSPKDIKKLDIDIFQDNPVGPNDSFPFAVVATNKNGRLFSTKNNSLPWSRLDIQGKGLVIDEGLANTDGCESYIYDKPSIVVSYKKSSAPPIKLDIPFSLESALSSYIINAGDITLSESAGKVGQRGRPGADGNDGSKTQGIYGSGTQGYPGQMGMKGGDGERGKSGPLIDLRVTKVALADRSKWLMLGQLYKNGQAVKWKSGETFFLRPIDSGSLRLVSKGGNGGNGGKGGAGGTGGDGGEGHSTGNGAPGGMGGNGGGGGAGGNGGDVIVRIASNDLSGFFQPLSIPGQPGLPGKGGSGGAGGEAPSVSVLSAFASVMESYSASQQGQYKSGPPQVRGSDAHDGPPGQAGPAGFPGHPGKNDIVVQNDIGRSLYYSVPQDVQECLWFQE